MYILLDMRHRPECDTKVPQAASTGNFTKQINRIAQL